MVRMLWKLRWKSSSWKHDDYDDRNAFEGAASRSRLMLLNRKLDMR